MNYIDTWNLYEYGWSRPTSTLDPSGMTITFAAEPLHPRPVTGPVESTFPRFAQGTEPLPGGSWTPKPHYDPTPPVFDPDAVPSGQQADEPCPKGPNPDHYADSDSRVDTKPWKYPNPNYVEGSKHDEGSDCSEQTLRHYTSVVAAQKTRANKETCSKLTWPLFMYSCNDIQRLRDNWDAYAEARRNRENRCFRGGNKGHQLATANAEFQVSFCEYLLRKKGCFGYTPPSEPRHPYHLLATLPTSR